MFFFMGPTRNVEKDEQRLEFNDEGAVPVGVPDALVLLPLALAALQIELMVYAAHDLS